MTTVARPILPKPALLAIGALLAATLVGAGAWRVAELPTRDTEAPITQVVALRFADSADGGVAVIDARSGTTLDVLHGEQGFLRGTLRGFARERKRRDIGAQAPLELRARADGRVTLADPSTGHRVDLDSFGPVNAAVFTRYMK